MQHKQNSNKKERMIVGISGASGFSYGIQALHYLKKLGVESHLVISSAGQLNREYETDISEEDIYSLADYVYSIKDVGAAIASGSFGVKGMLVAPCSMHTLAAIANGITNNLLIRAADVTLKERRPLVLMARETPLHAIHLKNMLQVTECGGIIFPPVPALYTKPKNIDEIISHSVARALSLFGYECAELPRWGETLSLLQK